MNGTVHYAVVALWDKSEYKIIADYSVDQNPNYRNIALNIFDSRTDKNDKIDSGGYRVHTCIGHDPQLYCACLTSNVDCPASEIWVESCAQIFLKRLCSVYKELPLADLSNLTNIPKDELSKPLKRLIEEYNQGITYKNLTLELEEELDEVRHILMTGVLKLIDRGEKLDDLVRKTQNLEISSRDFHVVTRTQQKKNSSLKIALVTSAFMLVIVSFLIALIYWFEVYCNSYTHGTLMANRTN